MELESIENNILAPKTSQRIKFRGLFIAIISLIILTLIVLGYVNVNKTREKQYNSASENLRIISDNKVDRINKWRNSIILGSRKFMNDIVIQRFLNDWFSSEIKKDDDTFIKKWLTNFLDSGEVKEFAVFSPERKCLVFSDKPENYSEKERISAFNKCLQGKDVVMSDLYFENEYDSARISVFIPVINTNSLKRIVSGVIMLEINPYIELFPIIEFWPLKSNLSQSVLIRRDSANVLYIVNRLSEKNSVLKLKSPLNDTDFVSVKAVNGRTGIFEGKDYNKREVISSSGNIQGTNWILLSSIDKEELDNQVAKTTNIILGFIFLIILFFVLLLVLVLRQYRLSKYSELLKIEKEKNIQFERLNTLLQNANDSILLLSSDGLVIDVNDKAVEVYGYSKKEFSKLNIRDLRAPEEKASFNSAYFDLKKKRSLVIETIHISKTGRTFPVEASASIITFDGEDYIQNIVRDISYRKETDKKLRESENMFKSAFDYANDAMFIMDHDIILDANRNAEILFGIPKKDMIGKRPFNLSPQYQEGGKASKEKALESISKAESGIPQFFEWIHRNSDGVDFNTEVSLNTIILENKNLIFAVVRDITFRKYAENTLRERENRLNLVLEGAEIGYYDMNMITGEVITNERCYKMLGYNANEIVRSRKWWRDIVHPDDAINSQIIWEEYLSGKRDIYEVEVRLRKKDGTWLWVLDKGKFFEVTEDGKPIRVAGTHLDISALKYSEEAMRIAKEAAEEASRLKSNFLANMSHELRTPMTGIIGFSEMLFTELEDSEHKEMAEMILKGGKRLTQTLNSILDLSRIEANQIEVKKNECNIIPLVENSVKLYQQAAKLKGLNIEINSDKDELFCILDEKIFEDILNNLIKNALTYTERGNISISVSTIIKGEISFAKISVKDTGIGIPEELHQQIFAPFRQVSEGLNRKYEGTGLGLTLTKKLIELMDGKIHVKSKVGEGSEFIVEIPLSTKKTEKMLNSIPADSVLPKALFVEDEYENFELIKILLKPYLNIENAVTGYDALEMIKSNNYAIIFMDIGLKGIDGMQTTKEIRKMDRYKNIPIIAITAFAMTGDKERILESGCDEYLPKPFKKEALFTILKKYINLNLKS
ncbi:MAG: PAS domain S-box protein [Ignavibacteria bacterium]|nr:PAS domain S-box protein [Ignavibacteria bacterium]